MIKVRIDPQSLAQAEKDLKEILEDNRVVILKGFGDKIKQSIQSTGGSSLKLTVEEEPERYVVSAYGPAATKIEKRTKAFQIAYDSAPNIFKTLKW